MCPMKEQFGIIPESCLACGYPIVCSDPENFSQFRFVCQLPSFLEWVRSHSDCALVKCYSDGCNIALEDQLEASATSGCCCERSGIYISSKISSKTEIGPFY